MRKSPLSSDPRLFRPTTYLRRRRLSFPLDFCSPSLHYIQYSSRLHGRLIVTRTANFHPYPLDKTSGFSPSNPSSSWRTTSGSLPPRLHPYSVNQSPCFHGPSVFQTQYHINTVYTSCGRNCEHDSRQLLRSQLSSSPSLLPLLSEHCGRISGLSTTVNI